MNEGGRGELKERTAPIERSEKGQCKTLRPSAQVDGFFLPLQKSHQEQNRGG